MYEELQHINQTEIDKVIADKIHSFYLDNYQELISSYNKLSNHDVLSDYYIQVDDESIINYLYVKTDLIVLTTSPFERNALHYQFISKETSDRISVFNIRLYPQLGDEQFSVRGYFFKWGNYNILNIESAEKSPYAFGGPTDIFRFVVDNKYLMPTACASLGICVGTPNTVYHIGDTIISSRIYPYFVSEPDVEANFFAGDNDIFRIAYSLSNQLKQNIFEKGLVSEESLGFNVQMGNFVTGDSSACGGMNQDYFNYVTSHQISAIATEGYGMFKECRGWKWRIPCIIIKAMYEYALKPDFSDYKDDKRFTDKVISYNAALASIHSAIVFNILLENEVFGKSIPKLIKQSLLPLRQEDMHVISCEDLEVIIRGVINRKFHSGIVTFSLSELIMERLNEENVISSLIIDGCSNLKVEYVRIIGEEV